MNIIIKLFSIIYITIICSITFAYAKDDNFPISFPHWVIGCDNNNVCTAIGFPYTERDENYDTSWYISIKWNVVTRNIINSYLKPTWGTGDISSICGLLKEEKCIDLLPYIKKTSINDLTIYDFKIDTQLINNITSITIQLDGDHAGKWTLDLSNFKNFSSTYKFTESHQIKNISAYPWYNYKKLDKNEVKKLLKENFINYTCENDNGFSFEVNGFKLLAACLEDGYNSSYKIRYAKSNPKLPPLISKNIEQIQKKYNMDGLITVDEIIGFSLDTSDKYKFYAQSIGRALGDCGMLITFIYDGKQFQITEIKSMPVCNYIDASDWPIIYSIPFEKKLLGKN